MNTEQIIVLYNHVKNKQHKLIDNIRLPFRCNKSTRGFPEAFLTDSVSGHGPL